MLVSSTCNLLQISGRRCFAGTTISVDSTDGERSQTIEESTVDDVAWITVGSTDIIDAAGGQTAIVDLQAVDSAWLETVTPTDAGQTETGDEQTSVAVTSTNAELTNVMFATSGRTESENDAASTTAMPTDIMHDDSGETGTDDKPGKLDMMSDTVAASMTDDANRRGVKSGAGGTSVACGPFPGWYNIESVGNAVRQPGSTVMYKCKRGHDFADHETFKNAMCSAHDVSWSPAFKWCYGEAVTCNE